MGSDKSIITNQKWVLQEALGQKFSQFSDQIQKLLFLKSCRNARLKPPQDKPE